MKEDSSSTESNAHLVYPILVGGALTGILDIIPAFISFGRTAPQGVAAALLGRSVAFQGGLITWLFGIAIHFFIAFVAAAVYCIAAKRLAFLAEHWVVCGLMYGVVVFLFMNLVVVPLSALHLAGPFPRIALLQGIIGNMFEVGLPISFSMRRFVSMQAAATATADIPEHRARSGVTRIKLLPPILTGGILAGALDKIAGFLAAGLRSPQGIAAGLVGRSIAYHGGAATWVLGMALHFFIALVAATVYCVAAQRLGFLRQHWLVCGPIYGIAVYLVMTLLVLPVSALHLAGPYTLGNLLQGVMIHMILVGLPISYCLRKFEE